MFSRLAIYNGGERGFPDPGNSGLRQFKGCFYLFYECLLLIFLSVDSDVCRDQGCRRAQLQASFRFHVLGSVSKNGELFVGPE